MAVHCFGSWNQKDELEECDCKEKIISGESRE
jgi:hypothetical protein